ncbi:Ubiquitin-conjugating enzyme E2 Z [Halotydeus destructor]|nr:Ubiquitin-conjugating enzyme E2 Z [Halotydeus destructor]
MANAAPPPPPEKNSASGFDPFDDLMASDLKKFKSELKAKKMYHINKLLGHGNPSWDPSQKEDGDTTELLPQTLLRIKRDLKDFFVDPVPEVFLVPEPDNMCVAHAIVMGPRETPYEGGMFYFYVKFPADYPIKPPKVKLMTTCKETVRFNPNLYRNGKVCLSILGTWSGPGWSPANNLSSVLLSIQSLMNEKPYHNEPGFEAGGMKHVMKSELNVEDPVKVYNDIITHETIRVAVLDMVDEDSFDTKNMPPALKEKIPELFSMNIPHYEHVISENSKLQGKKMTDPFGEPRGTFDYEKLKERLERLKAKYPNRDEDTMATDSSSNEYSKIAANVVNAEEAPNFPNANAKDVDANAAIDDANYYLDAEGTSGEDNEDADDDAPSELSDTED